MKTEKRTVEILGQPYLRWEARWKTHNSQIVCVQGPLYKTENTIEACYAFQKFEEMKKQNLLEHPESE